MSSIVDPELIAPLTKISDYLLSIRPGKVSAENIKRISSYYGFETFAEDNLIDDSTNNLINRLTIAGKIILIDIDFGTSFNTVLKVSLSLALNNSSGDNNNNTGKLSIVDKSLKPNCDDILFSNLDVGSFNKDGFDQSSQLAKFNANLKYLSNLDKLSIAKFDLFNYLDNLSICLKDIRDYQLNNGEEFLIKNDFLNEKELEQDLNNGYIGIGKYMINIYSRLGIFLKIWQDERFLINEDNDKSHYIYFGVKELDHNVTNSTIVSNINNNEKWWTAEFGWTDFQKIDKLNAGLNLFFNPTNEEQNVVVPESLMIKWGVRHYEQEEDPDEFSKFMIKFFNNNIVLKKLSSGKLDINLKLLLGSKLICLKSLVFPNPSLLQEFFQDLRSWFLVNNLIRVLISKTGPVAEEVAAQAPPPATAIATSATTATAIVAPLLPTNTDVIKDDTKLSSFIEENAQLLHSAHSNTPQRPTLDVTFTNQNSSNDFLIFELKQNLKSNLPSKIQLKIENGYLSYNISQNEQDQQDQNQNKLETKFIKSIIKTEDIIKVLQSI
ncbi:hypothetical protein PACTADRAFT_49071 [Pachysolen tannophilus NRRL Y-2460]|uniref:Mediator of RNA polymerase II transcription subunit 1 n=1 Tax=Pachysolen tannophilus NRRL Y-2460 TaxID=669874 RepID=A0A1E4U019_PACTA|nr:hypothetical protein PACTADRAFT_49071 [Pachysolen tannophilus NRRL Y-2460]